jgi:hypothetical protein
VGEEHQKEAILMLGLVVNLYYFRFLEHDYPTFCFT